MLSAIQVTKSAPAEKPYKLADGHGLYLLVQTTGSRLWRMNYRFDGRHRTLAIGPYPAVTLAAARLERDTARAHLAAGRDPSTQKQAEQAAAAGARQNTFKLVGEEWREKRKKEGLGDAALAKDREMLEVHAYPAFGSKPVTEIRATDILSVVRKMEARGHRTVTHRFRSTCSRVFRYAIITERAERDPAADLTGALLPKVNEPQAALTDPIKVGRMVNAISGYEGHAQVRLGMLFLAHTFVRTVEMRSAEWDWIDWPKRVLRIPAGVIKMKRPHVVPLSPQVLALLGEARTLALPGPLIFPGNGFSRPRMSENTINGALARLGYGKGIHTGHGFRRTASTVLHESGKFESVWIERQLAHVDGNTTRGIYNAAEHLEARRLMMIWYSDWLDAQSAVSALM